MNIISLKQSIQLLLLLLIIYYYYCKKDIPFYTKRLYVSTNFESSLGQKS